MLTSGVKKVKQQKLNHMLRVQNGSSQANGNVPAPATSKSLSGYFRTIRETLIEQFRAAPFGLNQPTAEKCASEMLKVIERNHKQARIAGLLSDA